MCISSLMRYRTWNRRFRIHQKKRKKKKKTGTFVDEGFEDSNLQRTTHKVTFKSIQWRTLKIVYGIIKTTRKNNGKNI